LVDGAPYVSSVGTRVVEPAVGPLVVGGEVGAAKLGAPVSVGARVVGSAVGPLVVGGRVGAAKLGAPVSVGARVVGSAVGPLVVGGGVGAAKLGAPVEIWLQSGSGRDVSAHDGFEPPTRVHVTNDAKTLFEQI
jgi:hypothetical protein